MEEHFTCSGCKFNYIMTSDGNNYPGGSCVHPYDYMIRDYKCTTCYYWEKPAEARSNFLPEK